MWKRLTLQTRLLILVAALTLTALAGGLVTVWHTDAIDSLLTDLIDQNVASFQASEELETALLRQKGYATYFFLDQNTDWLARLQDYHLTFLFWLDRAKASAYAPNMLDLLDQIEEAYTSYVKARQEVIRLYQQGRREQGAELHWQVRKQFQELYNLCERYKLIHERRIAEARDESRYKARFITNTALIIMPGVVFLGLFLGYVLFRQILTPIRALLREHAVYSDNTGSSIDEVQALSQTVHHLREDVDLAHSQLQRSQVSLAQSEKLALAGKLAAGVAHSIRNPLTSVKMRLFSLRRHLALPPAQQDDLDVISAEIRHIDAIVRNFLEYSRPPKLTIQPVSPSAVVDQAIALLLPRLESFSVTVTVNRKEPLPIVWADPDQFKEVLVNLMVNACEAMPKGGNISLTEEEDFIAGLGRAIRIRIQDTGPGILASMHGKIFQPFFSGKEEGTGLGLSIAARIIEEHGGDIEVDSRPGQGAAFIITLPLRKIKNGNNINSR
ncbi:MAG: histidine kinase [Deltaproteobacteria bacterium]|nr:histidine kinase [Deltaproteobacteria bacterium]